MKTIINFIALTLLLSTSVLAEHRELSKGEAVASPFACVLTGALLGTFTLVESIPVAGFIPGVVLSTFEDDAIHSNMGEILQEGYDMNGSYMTDFDDEQNNYINSGFFGSLMGGVPSAIVDSVIMIFDYTKDSNIKDGSYNMNYQVSRHSYDATMYIYQNMVMGNESLCRRGVSAVMSSILDYTQNE